MKNQESRFWLCEKDRINLILKDKLKIKSLVKFDKYDFMII